MNICLYIVDIWSLSSAMLGRKIYVHGEVVEFLGLPGTGVKRDVRLPVLTTTRCLSRATRGSYLRWQ